MLVTINYDIYLIQNKIQSTYSREEGNEWEKNIRNKIPNIKTRQTIAQESVWKAL
jgi:hypothetical protein